MKVAVPKENHQGERRVALVPDATAMLCKAGHEVLVQSGAGLAAGFKDAEYQDKGASIVADRAELFAQAEVVFQVRGCVEEGGLLRSGQVCVAMFDPLSNPEIARELAKCGVTAFAMELMPRITRAQSMDVLSSQSLVAGYKAVLLAANTALRMFPMFMTAAGTLSPAHVLVVGAGVAGLQAIATARRLGAVVKGYDIRPAVKEQIESLGAKFVEMKLETADTEGKGGYAKEMGDEFLRQQRELMTGVVAESHVVITTAAIPGKKSPVIVTADMVRGMKAGSVIVDLAAERGGNCELTRVDETVVKNEVTILGPSNLPAEVPMHASQMYARNLVTFLKELTDDQGALALDMENEVHRETMLTRDGEVVHERIKQLLGDAPASA